MGNSVHGGKKDFVFFLSRRDQVGGRYLQKGRGVEEIKDKGKWKKKKGAIKKIKKIKKKNYDTWRGWVVTKERRKKRKSTKEPLFFRVQYQRESWPSGESNSTHLFHFQSLQAPRYLASVTRSCLRSTLRES